MLDFYIFVFCSPTIITTSSKLMLGFQLDDFTTLFLNSWFHPHLSRQQAEEMLKTVHMDGAYLVRPSDNPKYYAISFR